MKIQNLDNNYFIAQKTNKVLFYKLSYYMLKVIELELFWNIWLSSSLPLPIPIWMWRVDRQGEAETPEFSTWNLWRIYYYLIQGYTILGASCLTEGGAQYGLLAEYYQGKYRYRCICAGKSMITKFQKNDLSCRLHYWECPLRSWGLLLNDDEEGDMLNRQKRLVIGILQKVAIS